MIDDKINNLIESFKKIKLTTEEKDIMLNNIINESSEKTSSIKQ